MGTTPQVVYIDPVTRIEGHLQVKAVIDYVQNQLQVVDAQIGGTLFRGFEKILVGRSPLDAPDLCERICGVCTVSHGLAASLALENAGVAGIPNNARVLRNLILAADTLQSHILHFYAMALPDFAEIQQMAPWTPTWLTDRRISGSAASQLAAHYAKALEMRRKAHEMGALFAGRLPHSPALVPGGITVTPRQARIDSFRAYSAQVLNFVQNEYQSDVQLIAAAYSDYFSLGTGPRNLICYGGFNLDNTGSYKFFPSGVVQNASQVPATLDVNAILEDPTYSWYQSATATYLRINAGGPAYTDPQGSVWNADYGSNGLGGIVSITTPITGTTTPALYQTWRWGPRSGTPLTYTFNNLSNGNYTVTLKFDETLFTQAGKRVFHVVINGQTVLSNFDIFAAAGGTYAAVDRQIPVTVTAGQIVIQFIPVLENPKICAIQIMGGSAQIARNPASGDTTPQYPKTGAYSWLKAPRYNNQAVETGPLARMWVKGTYQNGISVMDRHMARFTEALQLAQQLDVWAQELQPTAPVYQRYVPPTSASGYGLLEAPRGALGHWLSIAAGKISLYQVVTPTCWNASPHDNAGVPGPLEQALIGLPVQNASEPVEVVRVIRSFDPCMACAVHVLRPAENGTVFRL